MIKQIAATTETGQSQQSQPWINKSGTRSKSGFLPPCFNSIFLLTRHSSVFQIIPLNWKHLNNPKVQGKKVFWHVSNNVNEVIRAVLNFFFFLRKDFTHTYWRNVRCEDCKQSPRILRFVSMCVLTISACEDSCVKLRSLHLN